MKRLQRRGHLGAAAFWVVLVGLCWQGANAQQEINRLRPPMPIPNVVALMPPTVPLSRSVPTPIPPPPIPPERPTPVMMPILPRVSLPPAEYDHPYAGKLTVLKEDTYNFIRHVCRDTVRAIACSYRTYDSATGANISCLIMLGPGTWSDERVLRHEIGHCNGWSNNHERARE
jgi:hypothetical protein